MWIAFLLAAGAGLSTAFGSLLGVVIRKPGPKFVGFTLGFSAGVMILVSFVELLPKAIATEGLGFLGANLAFLAGMAVYFLIDLLIPHDYIGQHDHREGDYDLRKEGRPQALERTGLLVALGISIHNFPEGMVTLVGTLGDIQVGVAIAVAIALHNIPEGLAIAAPIYAATRNRGKALFWSLLSGLSEIAGAGIAAIVLGPFLTETVMGVTLAVVAGIMVVISLDELLPAAKAMTSEHTPLIGVLSGMVVMVLSLWMMQ
jgi:ZIP family zinc transporter